MRAMIALLALAVALAGCAGDSETPAPAEQDPCLVESADDFSCADQDANKTADQVAHVHDYWGGRETVRVLEESNTLGASIISSCDAWPTRSWLPAEGLTVFQGTGRVEITTHVEYSLDHRSGQLEVWVQRADQDTPEYVADLEDGNTVTLEVNHSAADLPHQALSAWEFWVYTQPDPTTQPYRCDVWPRANVTFEVDIHKTLEVRPFPGHPDHWNGTDERPFLDAYASYGLNEEVLGSCTSGESSHAEGSCSMHWRGFGPQNGSIVPPGTDHVRLTLTLEPDDAEPDATWGLRFHGADTREFQHIEPVSREGDTAVYEIAAAGITDGPYSEQSQWRFQLVNESDHQAYLGGWTLQGPAVKGP